MKITEYQSYVDLLQSDPQWSHQIEWSETVRYPETPMDLALELIFVICNSGMHHKAARSIFTKIQEGLDRGEPVTQNFGHRGKAESMQYILDNQARLYEEGKRLKEKDLVEWCGKLPYIGRITKYHAAKNLGADVVKPDRWLDRIADKHSTTPEKLCSQIAAKHPHRIATVDLVLWWAAANGHISGLRKD